MSYDEQPDGDPHGECTAEIHRLEAELATLESQQSRDGEVIRKQDEEIARLTAERDAALVDAERYKELRDTVRGPLAITGFTFFTRKHGDPRRESDIDMAVDRQIAARKEGAT